MRGIFQLGLSLVVGVEGIPAQTHYATLSLTCPLSPHTCGRREVSAHFRACSGRVGAGLSPIRWQRRV